MKPLIREITITAGIILSGCSLFQSSMLGATLSDANVLAMFDIINLIEIDSSNLAQDKASSEDVKTFASIMLSEHTVMMQDTRQLAQQINVDPQTPVLASTVGKRHQETMEELRRISGADFDQAYLKYQIQVHEQAIGLVENTAEAVHDRRLQQYLKEARQYLVIHLSAANAIERNVVARY